MAMFAAIQDIHLYDKDWNKIMALLSRVDANTMLDNINTAHLTDRALTAVKSDPDTPSLMEALMGEHGNDFHARRHVQRDNSSHGILSPRAISQRQSRSSLLPGL